MPKRTRLRRKEAKKKYRLPYLHHVSIVTYNVSYPKFERLFVKHGGTSRMARHIWDKWKVEHKDDFLGMFGNLDYENVQIVQNVVDDLISEKW